MINANKWTDKSTGMTGTIQECEYMQEQGTNNVRFDLGETGYEY